MDVNITAKYDFQRICRICLSESSDMSNIFNSDRNICEIVTSCSDIKLAKDDGLPEQICKICTQQAEDAVSFKHKCEISDVKLRHYVTNTFNNLSDMDIKGESLLGISDINDYFKCENQSPDSIFTSPKDKRFYGFQPFDTSVPKYECVLCKDIFYTSKDLVFHIHNHSISLKEEEVTSHVCDLCKGKFHSSFELTKHQSIHKELLVDGNKFVCPLCQDHFVNHDGVLRHLSYHLEESHHKCNICRCFFTSKLHLKRHNQRAHYNTDPECNPKENVPFDPDNILIKCENDNDENNLTLDSSTCELDLGADDLIASIEEANLNGDYGDQDLNNDCGNLTDSDYDANKILSEIIDEADSKFYKTKKNGSKSKRCDISIKLDVDNISESFILEKNTRRKRSKSHKCEKKIGIKRERGKIFSCDQCPKKFHRLEYLEDHQKRHTGERSFLCSQCGKGYFKQSHLDKHMMIHLNEPSTKPIYKCPLCNRVVKHSNHLQAHMRTHKGKNGEPILPSIVNPNKISHLCSTCGRSCSSRSNLAVHMRRHLGTKTSICKICGKGYPRTTDLTLHMRQHTGERPFICNICNKAFARSDKLAIHMRTHTGEKPYLCSICGRAFAQSNDLASHKKRKTCSQISIPLDPLSINCVKSEDHLLLLSQNSQIEVTPVEGSTFKPETFHQQSLNHYKPKRKKNAEYSEAMNLATNSSQMCDEVISPKQPRLMDLANPNAMFVLSNSKNNDLETITESKNVGDLIKHGFGIPELVASRAIDLASGSHSLLGPRTDLTDFTTAALLQIQSAHFR